ncbi:ABC transporter related [Euzebya pacifica]|uniref:ABC transporter related n=1 Tax=Euzebya pacifica TaxID=1608957 RepID=A0A346XUM5_9ACTN|nr:CocE/NonD family hydrolase [Euzebya pacifica]AXV05922.1 ABC transporter related [Euzebya pacifica]
MRAAIKSLSSRRAASALAAGAAALALLAPTPSVAEQPVEQASFSHTVTSLAADGIDIDIQVFKPAMGAGDTVPVLLHSHGWGGSKSTNVSSYQAELDAGYGVVSITQRGHGASGGLRNVEDPDFEGLDMIAVVDYIAGLDWVAKESLEQDSPWADPARGGDPVLGAWGGSYGGGYQYVLALTEMQLYGATRVDAMAPDITWHNLNTALAPNDVPRSAWLTLLYSTGANKVERYISEGFAYGIATGQYADGTVPGLHDLKAEFETHGPAGYVDDNGDRIHLDIPMLITQGFSDNLFIFNEAWDNFTQTLTPEARDRSMLVGYNGGHALPNVYPVGYAGSGDKCDGTSGTTRRAFFDAAFNGGDTRLLGNGEPFHYTTASSECLRLTEADIDFEASYQPQEVDPTGTLGPATGGATMAGAPISLELAQGPLTIAGVPELSADLYGLGYDQRLFFTLSKGTSPANAQTIQNNVMPYRMAGPVPSVGEAIEMRLPGIAETIDEGESLYLTVSPTSDMFFGHGSRTPGFVGMTDVTVTIPTVIAD